MFAELAKHDLEKLRAKGINPTDADVVRLNDLAVLLERGKETTAANFPRVAFAGNIALHEPTCAALAWWWQYGKDAFADVQSQLRTHYFAMAYARRPEVFRDLTEPKDIRRAVRTWLKGVGATDGELFRAMMYVKCGEVIAEDPDAKEPDEGETLKRLEVLMLAASGDAGISREDAAGYTQSELVRLIDTAHRRAGKEIKPSTSKLYMRYMAALREIEARGKDADGE